MPRSALMASCCLRVSAFAASSGSRQGVELFFAAEEEADPVGLVADGEEATVVFEGAGVLDAVLVELPQEARSRGRIASAAPRRRPLERSERKTGVWVNETTSREGVERYIASQYTLDGVACGVFCKYPHGMAKISANYLEYLITVSRLRLVRSI